MSAPRTLHVFIASLLGSSVGGLAYAMVAGWDGPRFVVVTIITTGAVCGATLLSHRRGSP